MVACKDSVGAPYRAGTFLPLRGRNIVATVTHDIESERVTATRPSAVPHERPLRDDVCLLHPDR